MAKLLCPNDPAKAEDLYAPRLYIPAQTVGGEASTVRGRFYDIIDNDESGWHSPMTKRASKGSRSASRSGTNSPRRVSSGVGLPGGIAGGGNPAGGNSGMRNSIMVNGSEDEDL
jgi:hypothetical protein